MKLTRNSVSKCTTMERNRTTMVNDIITVNVDKRFNGLMATNNLSDEFSDVFI